MLLQHKGAIHGGIAFNTLFNYSSIMSKILNQWLSRTCMKYLGNALIVIQFLKPILEQICDCETELHIQYGVIVD